MKSVSFLWKRKDNKNADTPDDDVLPSKYTSQTLPRSMSHANLRAGMVDFPAPRRQPLADHFAQYGQDNQDVFTEPTEFQQARQRSQSMGAQHAPSSLAPRSIPSAGGPSELPPLPTTPTTPSYVTRPLRKSSLVPPRDKTRPSVNAPHMKPPLSRGSSSSSLQMLETRVMQTKRSMPDLKQSRERGTDMGANTTSTRWEFKSKWEYEYADGKPRQRAVSTASHGRPGSGQRFADLPHSPSPSFSSTSTISRTSSSHSITPAVTSPRRSRFSNVPPPSSSRVGVSSSLTYLQEDDDLPQSSSETFNSPTQSSILTYPPEEARPSTPTSINSDSSEITASMFPVPPPLDLHFHLSSRPTTPSIFTTTPDFTPLVTPTTTIFGHTNLTNQTKKPSPPTSILKRSTGSFTALPSPPITPSTPSPSTRSFKSSLPAAAISPPTLKVRNSAPQFPSSKVHNVHRPTSSDAYSDKSNSSSASERADLRKKLLSRPETPSSASAPRDRQDTSKDYRPVSPESDSQSIQWGYAV